jgi:hypothetical protein
LLEAMQRRRDELIANLATGQADAPFVPPAGPGRAAEVAKAIGAGSIDTEALWPELQLVSCWMDASSAPFAAELQRRIPHADFQAKGLMSTEGVATVPFGEGPGSPAALESGFFEFADAEGRVQPLWQLNPGEVRRVILSNGAGLYRYDTEDMVEVVGFEAATPRLRFLGRAGATSDLCGEKLTEHFVSRCLQATLASGEYALLAAATEPQPHYQLWIDGDGDDERRRRLADAVDAELSANPQYAYARRLGQLKPVAPCAAANLYERYRTWALGEGRNIGDLKAPTLLRRPPVALRDIILADPAT